MTEPCPDCAVTAGMPHEDGCDVARCLQSGQQRLMCDADHDCGNDIWTGEWPYLDANDWAALAFEAAQRYLVTESDEVFAEVKAALIAISRRRR